MPTPSNSKINDCSCRTKYIELHNLDDALDNNHMESLQGFTCGPFKEVFVEQVSRVRASVFDKMCQELNVTDYQDQMCVLLSWLRRQLLATSIWPGCCILDTCC